MKATSNRAFPAQVAALMTAPDDDLLFVNVADLDVLAAKRTYVACTSEKVLADKTHVYDVFVDNRRVVVKGGGGGDEKKGPAAAARRAAGGAAAAKSDDDVDFFDDDGDDDCLFPFLNAVVFGEKKRRRHRAFGAKRGSVTAPRVVAEDSSALALTEGDRLRWRRMRRHMQTQGMGADGDTEALDAVVADTFAAMNDKMLAGLLRAARTGVDVTTLTSLDHFGLHRSDATFLRALADEIRVDHPGFKESDTWNADTRRTPAKPPRPPRDTPSRRQAPPLP